MFVEQKVIETPEAPGLTFSPRGVMWSELTFHPLALDYAGCVYCCVFETCYLKVIKTSLKTTTKDQLAGMAKLLNSI